MCRPSPLPTLCVRPLMAYDALRPTSLSAMTTAPRGVRPIPLSHVCPQMVLGSPCTWTALSTPEPPLVALHDSTAVLDTAYSQTGTHQP